MGETAVDWAIACWFCKKQFMSSEAGRTEDGFVKCPHCYGWAGYEMKKKRPSMEGTAVYDPGQDRLLTDFWVWVVVDPKTQLEGVCGVIVDGCSRLAISATREEAVRLADLVLKAKASSQKTFRLVRYGKEEVEMEL